MQWLPGEQSPGSREMLPGTLVSGGPVHRDSGCKWKCRVNKWPPEGNHHTMYNVIHSTPVPRHLFLMHIFVFECEGILFEKDVMMNIFIPIQKKKKKLHINVSEIYAHSLNKEKCGYSWKIIMLGKIQVNCLFNLNSFIYTSVLHLLMILLTFYLFCGHFLFNF